MDTVLLALVDRDLRRQVSEALEREERIEILGVVDDSTETVQSALTSSPTVVVVGASSQTPWVEVCTYVSLVSPASWIILLVEEEITRAILDTAMLVGVRQVLPVPEGIQDIPEVLRRLHQVQESRQSHEFLMAADPLKCPRLIAVSGAKGGVGKTTLAANLGAALAARNVGSTVVWDAYCQFGDVANVMGLPTNRTLAELTQLKPEDLDEDLILNYAVHHDSGADVLLCSDTPLPLDAVGESFTDQVIKALRKRYRFAVVDTPPLFHEMSNLIFARCWRLFIVTTLKDVTAISDAMKLMQAIEQGIRTTPVRIVANRVGRGDSVKEREIESLLGKPLTAAIPEDPTVAQANNLGVPVLKVAPHGPASKAIIQLADLLIQSASTFSADAL